MGTDKEENRAVPGNLENLDRVFKPRSVAIVGASTSPKKFGYVITDMLLKQGYAGRVYPINPSASEICGLPSYPSLADVPDEVDVATIVLPAEMVLQAFKEAIDKRVGGVVIISSGFAETEMGSELQRELARLSRQSGVRIIGPNCEGFINQHRRLILTFSLMFANVPQSGPVSFVSQSGAYSGIVFRRVNNAGVRFSKVVSSGNEADVNATELFEYFAEDPDTGVIVAYLEEIRQPRQFFARMREVSRLKPVVVNKVGWTAAGQRAAQSHTGALAGSDQVVDAILRQSGVVRARHLDELVDLTVGLATQPILRGNRVAILSTAGGLAVETSDLCGAYGFTLPQLQDKTREGLGKIVPYYGSTANPVDLTASALQNYEWPGMCIKIAADDDNVDAVILVLTAMRDIEIAQHVLEAIKSSTKPVFLCWTAGELAGEALNYLQDHGVPVFSSPNRVLTALRGLKQRGRFLLANDFIEQR